MSIEIQIGSDSHTIKTEDDMLLLIEVMKAEGAFGNPLICPVCAVQHKVIAISGGYIFDCSVDCTFTKAIFESRLYAIRSLKALIAYVEKLKVPKRNKIYQKTTESTPLEKPVPPTLKNPKRQVAPKKAVHKFREKEIIEVIKKESEAGKSYGDIAAILNEYGLLTSHGLEWTNKNIYPFIKTRMSDLIGKQRATPQFVRKKG